MANIQAFDFSIDLLRTLLWQYNEAENLEALLTKKQEFLDSINNDFWQDWITDVFNLQTANEFGLSVWSIILNLPLFTTDDSSPSDFPAWGFGAEVESDFFMPLRQNLDIIRGTGSATFARSTTATFIDPSTLAPATSAINSPRFEANGLLIEGASTNKLIQSENLGTAQWTTVGNCSIGSFDDFGVINSFRMQMGDATGDTQSGIGQSGITQNQGDVITRSFFAKAGGGTFGSFIGIATDTFANYVDAGGYAINLNDGSVIRDDSTGTLIGGHRYIGNGWYFIYLTAETAASDGTTYLYRIKFHDENGNATPDGDSSSFVFLAGPQWEELPFASSYIPTTTAAVTRSHDQLQIPGGNVPIGDLFTFYCEFLSFGNTGDFQIIWQGNIGISSTQYNLRTLQNMGTGWLGSEGLNIPSDDILDRQFHKHVFRTTSNGNRAVIFTDGTKSDEFGAMPSQISSIDIGNDSGLFPIYGYLRDFSVFNSELTDGQVAQISRNGITTVSTGANQNFNHGSFAISASEVNRLSLEQKRTLLRLRYFQLVSTCTAPEINEFMNEIFGPGRVYVNDGLNMAISYIFLEIPDQNFIDILEQYDLLPRPSGVGSSIVIAAFRSWGFGEFHQNFDNGNFFGN